MNRQISGGPYFALSSHFPAERLLFWSMAPRLNERIYGGSERHEWHSILLLSLCSPPPFLPLEMDLEGVQTLIYFYRKYMTLYRNFIGKVLTISNPFW